MTAEEFKARLTQRTGETDAAVLNSYMEDSAMIVINKVYPFWNGEELPEVPLRYQNRQLEIAVYLMNKRGAEGQESHKENGIDRTYESASVPASMLEGLLPFCKIP